MHTTHNNAQEYDETCDTYMLPLQSAGCDPMLQEPRGWEKLDACRDDAPEHAAHVEENNACRCLSNSTNTEWLHE